MVSATHIVAIDSVIVGERVRDDYGEIPLLVASLQKWGQLLPILVDQDFNLCDGGRRIMAMRSAGFQDILVTQREMTPEEREEIELEVDRQHKPLTPLETSKRYVKQAAEAAEALRRKSEEEEAKNSSDLLGDVPQKMRGAPAKEVTKEDVAKAVGIDRSTLRLAEQHVEAVQQYPDLAPLPQKRAIREAKKERLKNDPVAAAEAEEKLLEADARVQRTRLLKAYAIGAYQVGELIRLKPENLADAFDEAQWEAFERTARATEEWIAAMRRARARGLHLVS